METLVAAEPLYPCRTLSPKVLVNAETVHVDSDAKPDRDLSGLACGSHCNILDKSLLLNS